MMDFDALNDNQKKFIINKVKELGDYKQVRRFYNQKDLVGAFAQTTAIDIFGEGELDPWVGELEPKRKSKKKSAKKKSSKKAKAKTVKKKRKINVDEVMSDDS